MQIEPSHIIAILALLVSGAGFFTTMKRNNKIDNSSSAADMGKIMEKLDSFGREQREMREDVKQIRGDMGDMREDVIELRVRMKMVEQTLYGDNNKGGDNDE